MSLLRFFFLCRIGYPHFRVHMSIVSGIPQEAGIFNNSIRFACDWYIRVWAIAAPRHPFRPSSRDADSIGRYGEAAERYAWRAAGRNETERKDGTPTGESDYTGTTFLPVRRVEGRGERTPATPVTCLQCQSLFLCSFCDFRIYQSHCLYNRRYGKTIFD